jgi:hypothetical protein
VTDLDGVSAQMPCSSSSRVHQGASPAPGKQCAWQALSQQSHCMARRLSARLLVHACCASVSVVSKRNCGMELTKLAVLLG